MAEAALKIAAVVSAGLLPALTLLDRDKSEFHPDPVEHYKYGSIGAEERAGIPYWIWVVLPRLFPELLPDRSGEGYERFGFVYESPESRRPIGTSYRERQVPMVGLNCAVCHTGTLRDSAAGPRRVVLGMPSHQFDLQAYQRFLFGCARSGRFTAANVLASIKEVNPEFSWLDSLLYRLLVVRRTRDGILEQARKFSWFEERPPQGPGRVDTFNPYKGMFEFEVGPSVGTADLPSLWNQRSREGLWLHWDGNNDSVSERNKSAAIGAGASESSLDLDGMRRVEEWIWDLKPPAFPSERVDAARAQAGSRLFEKHCAECHAWGGLFTGKVIGIEEIGTDSERLRSFTSELSEKMNTLGTGRPWKFHRFRKTEGYAAMPLDGVWLRAPYLHNGSVPTLKDLLKRPEERPDEFRRGYDVYDYDAVGFVYSGPDAERAGVLYDTRLKGNGKTGHLYGTDLTKGEKAELIEYLKTL